jgi:hypothetical protein
MIMAVKEKVKVRTFCRLSRLLVVIAAALKSGFHNRCGRQETSRDDHRFSDSIDAHGGYVETMAQKVYTYM